MFTRQLNKSRSRKRSYERLVGYGVSATLGSVVLAGCTTHSTVDNIASLQQEAINKNIACPTSPEKQTTDQAETCKDFKQTGKIALVGYGIELQYLKLQATAAQKNINDLYGTSFTITPLEASESTTAKLDENLGSDTVGKCIDAEKSDRSVVRVARTQMADELRDYDAVIGISELDDCNLTQSGSFLGFGQYIEVMGARDITASETITHEVGHMLGLGHAGEFFSKSDYANDTYIPFLNEFGADGNVDLSKILSVSAYESYGDGCNVMGSEYFCSTTPSDYTPPRPVVLNPLQKHFLDWPARVLTSKASVTQSLDTPGTQVDLLAPLPAIDAKRKVRIAELTLEQPFMFDGLSGGTDGTFTKLALTADIAAPNSCFYKMCVDLYLHNGESTAYLGKLGIFEKNESKTQTITFHNQKIVVKFVKGHVFVSAE